MTLVSAQSFRAAQDLVPFPVLHPPGSVESLSVRPETAEVWATVYSIHRYKGALVRVKQFVFDWNGSFCCPANLIHGEGETFGPIIAFPLGDVVGFYGTDYTGRKAGSVVKYLVHAEARVVQGHLEAEDMRRFLAHTDPAIPDQAISLAARPLPLWSFTMRTRRPPWPRATTIARLQWFTNLDEAFYEIGHRLTLPDLAGWRFEALGFRLYPLKEFRVIYRSSDLHRTLEVHWMPGENGQLAEPLRFGSYYQHESFALEGIEAEQWYAPPFGEDHLVAYLGKSRLVVIVAPTPHFDHCTNRRLLAAFVPTFRDC
jgi:hypothetical protein